MTADEFGTEFKASFRKLWVIAVAIVHDRASADDVVQEAAVVALSKLSDFKEGTSFVAWMGQIVRYTGLNRARQDKKAVVVEPASLERPAPAGEKRALTDSGKLAALQEHFDDRVVESLLALSDVARTCLLLRTLEDLSYEEIAKVLEIPANTAMSHVHRARAQMRKALTREVPT